MNHPFRRFAMSMAKEMGCPNVDWMLERITSSQLTEWMAYSNIEEEEYDKREKAQQVMNKARGR